MGSVKISEQSIPRPLPEVNYEAIQELNKTVELLTNQVSSLQDKNEELVKQIRSLQEQIDAQDMRIAGLQAFVM